MPSSDHRNMGQRPLLDFIPDNDLDASDEEDGFYSKEDDDFIIHPKWRQMAAQAANHVPRRVQRYVVIGLGGLLVFFLAWVLIIRPIYGLFLEEGRKMDMVPQNYYDGSNVRPEFKGTTHISTMDEKYLPNGEKRLVIVGDVHGCKEELEKLLEKVGFKQENDHLILTGDIVAKGPDSSGVVSLAQTLGASCVRGNHEDKVLLTLADRKAPHLSDLAGPNEDPNRENDFLDEESFSQGDYKLRKLIRKFSKSNIQYLEQCPVILRVGQIPNIGNTVVVHAGLAPDIPLEQQDPYSVMNMRSIHLETRLPSDTRYGTPWATFWNHRQKKLPEAERTMVFYGHDRKTGLNVDTYSVGLDTGCVAGGKLTAMVIDGEGKMDLVHVKCSKKGGY